MNMHTSTTAAPVEHDYTRPRWGRDIVIHSVIDGGKKILASGWGCGINDGDYLILPNDESTTRYAVETINYPGDPSDYWNASLIFAPRATP